VAVTFHAEHAPTKPQVKAGTVITGEWATIAYAMALATPADSFLTYSKRASWLVSVLFTLNNFNYEKRKNESR
jgi:hypothetical protein